MDSKIHAAVDTLGHLLALRAIPATEQDRLQAGTLAAVVQEATGRNVELAYVRPRIHRGESVEEARRHGIRLEVVKHPEDK